MVYLISYSANTFLKGVLHPLLKISMFVGIPKSSTFFRKIMHASESKLSKELQNGIKFLVGPAVKIMFCSGVATGVARGAECHPWQRKICQKLGKRGKKSGKIGKKEEKSGREGKNREGSFTLPLLTNRAGYATDVLINNSRTTWPT